MRIVVDRMPENPEDCPYCRKERLWIGCNVSPIVCEDTSKYPIFTAHELTKNEQQ